MVYILVTFISYYLFFFLSPLLNPFLPAKPPSVFVCYLSDPLSLTGVASMSVGRRAIYQNGQFTRNDTNGESLSSSPLTAKSSSEGLGAHGPRRPWTLPPKNFQNHDQLFLIFLLCVLLHVRRESMGVP